ncbi:MAG: SPOR domain-containing protein [Candidatus Acidiferrales bacterium]
MAGGNGKRGGGDRVLESRHLVGLFLGVVLLCSVFFTLGYVMGRTQYGPPLPVHASAAGRDIVTGTPSELSKPADAVPVPPNSEWDFDKQRDNNQLQHSSPASDTSAFATAPAAPTADATSAPKSLHGADTTPSGRRAAKTISANAIELRRFQAPRISRGQIVLQIAAMTKETDAVSVADAAQRKSFPSFIVIPAAGDNLYHVQVGPYADVPAAERAKDSLDHAGFKAIIKR